MFGPFHLCAPVLVLNEIRKMLASGTVAPALSVFIQIPHPWSSLVVQTPLSRPYILDDGEIFTQAHQWIYHFFCDLLELQNSCMLRLTYSSISDRNENVCLCRHNYVCILFFLCLQKLSTGRNLTLNNISLVMTVQSCYH